MLQKLKSFANNKYFISFILGSISATAFAPFYFFFFAIIAFSGLLLISGLCHSKKESFRVGWCFGFGQFLFGLYWICISLFVDAEKFLWLLPFALFLIPAVLAVYVGLVLLCVDILDSRLRGNDKVVSWQKILLFSLIWTFFEFLRATLFTGFPWNLIGYSFLFSLSLSQIASIVGIYGLSIIAVIFYSSFSFFISYKNSKIKFNFGKKNLPFFSIILLSIIALYFYGHWRLRSTYFKPIPSAVFRLVQPNIKQENKWDSASRYNSFLENIHLSKMAGFDQVNFVVWSESAVPYALDSVNSIDVLEDISKAIPKNGAVITGALRAQFKEQEMRELDKIWNSVFMIGENGKIIANYDKNHLVPFGEYIPFQKYLPFISKITDGAVGFSKGDGLKTIKLQNTSFSPLVCYEAIFTNKTIDKNNPPQFLLNVTNDAWFGSSSGPYQHFDMARMRSIEYGMPLIRVANSGISALVDPLGQIVSAIPLNRKGVLDVMMMEKLPQTPYSKYGNDFLFLIIGAVLIMVFKPKR